MLRLALLALLLTPAGAESQVQPAVLTPYPEPPPMVPLSAQDQAALARGEAVRKSIQEGPAQGRGVAVLDVDAPAEVVWSRILDFERYPEWIDTVKEFKVYRREGDAVYARLVAGQFGLDLTWYVEHHVHVDEGYLTWTLDYDVASEIRDTVGFWRVVPLDTQHSRVYYSVGIAGPSWTPEKVAAYVTEKGLSEATTWVKVQSEKEWARRNTGG